MLKTEELVWPTDQHENCRDPKTLRSSKLREEIPAMPHAYEFDHHALLTARLGKLQKNPARRKSRCCLRRCADWK